ncbi:hypothetical protein LCGC14_2779310, partial [marine sediment metagenome]
TRRLTGEVLELTERREMFDFQREIRQQAPAPQPPRQPGLPSFVEDVFRQVGRVAAPGFEDAFLPENVGGLAPPIPDVLVDVETRAATRYTELLEETRQSFPARTPPGTTIESLALERLDAELGDELRAAQPEQEKGLFGKLLSGAIAPFQTVMEEVATLGGVEREQVPQLEQEVLRVPLTGLAAGIGELEKDPLIGGPLARTAPGQFPHFDPEGTTAFEEGAKISRPVVQAVQPVVAEPFEQVEAAGIPVVSPVSGGVATAIQSKIVEDIATEVINPAALVLVAPIALQATVGLRGVAAAEALVSNLLATGMEPKLIRGTLRGLTLLSREGLAALPRIAKSVRATRVFQEAEALVRAGEAGGRRPTGPLRGGEPAPGFVRLYRGQRSARTPVPLEPPSRENVDASSLLGRKLQSL